jgi:hypothetical protein
MVEPGTGLAVLGTSLISKDLLLKVLGPTAEYLGEGLKGFAERRVQNLANVFKAAERKLLVAGSRGGTVPPRVLGATLNDASYAEDSVTVEYFGGVLASSRSGVSRDDRGAAFAALVGRLSTYEVRAHYVIYSIIRSFFLGTYAASQHTLLEEEGRRDCRTFIPLPAFLYAMAFEPSEDAGVIMSHTLFGLAKEDLIGGTSMAYGNADYIRRVAPAADSDGLVVEPTALGAELFLWANGFGHVSAAAFFNQSLAIEPLAEVKINDGSFSALNGRQRRLA